MGLEHCTYEDILGLWYVSLWRKTFWRVSQFLDSPIDKFVVCSYTLFLLYVEIVNKPDAIPTISFATAKFKMLFP